MSHACINQYLCKTLILSMYLTITTKCWVHINFKFNFHCRMDSIAFCNIYYLIILFSNRVITGGLTLRSIFLVYVRSWFSRHRRLRYKDFTLNNQSWAMNVTRAIVYQICQNKWIKQTIIVCKWASSSVANFV